VELLHDGTSAYEAWLASIAKARKTIHLLFYIWKSDRIGTRMRDALIEAAQRGVKVRMLLDGVGAGARKSFFRPLVAAGVEVRWFLPPWQPRHALALNFRNHRKLLVVDGHEGFVGGMNVADEYETWVDCAARLRGPAVDQLQEVFCDDWYFAAGEDIVEHSPFGAWAGGETRTAQGASVSTVAGGPHQELNAVREVTLSVLGSAERRVWLVTPYFIPDGALITILRLLRYRGVDVRVLLPARSDVLAARRASRAYYPELLRAGIRIFEHRGMVHAKAAVIDEEMSIIGSANLDQRSFRLNFEITTIIDDASFNGALAGSWSRWASDAVEIQPSDFDTLPWPTRVVDAALHLASPTL
jgi:cardiolipin synthase